MKMLSENGWRRVKQATGSYVTALQTVRFACPAIKERNKIYARELNVVRGPANSTNDYMRNFVEQRQRSVI